MTRALSMPRRRACRRTELDPIARLAEVGYEERAPQDWLALERAKRTAAPSADYEQLLAEAKAQFDAGYVAAATGTDAVRPDGTQRRPNMRWMNQCRCGKVKHARAKACPACQEATPPQERKPRTGVTQNHCRCGQLKPVAKACCATCRPSWPCKHNCGRPIGDMPAGLECRPCNNARRRAERRRAA